MPGIIREGRKRVKGAWFRKSRVCGQHAAERQPSALCYCSDAGSLDANGALARTVTPPTYVDCERCKKNTRKLLCKRQKGSFGDGLAALVSRMWLEEYVVRWSRLL